MSLRKIVIAGLARNCAAVLAEQVAEVNRRLSPSFSIQWIIIESDSSDGTDRVLSSLANQNLRYECLGNLSERIPQRTARIAHCRNRYLRLLRECAEYREATHLLVLDLDGVSKGLTAEGLLSCFERQDWGGCFSNRNGPYYDVWALRHPYWSPNDCWKAYEFMMSRGGSHRKAVETAVYSRMIIIPPASDWVAVDSAFGGAAVYNLSAVREGQFEYCGLDASGAEICEHVDFNQALRKAGHALYINPQFTSGGWCEHSVPLKLRNVVRRRIMEMVKMTPLYLLLEKLR